MKWITRSHIHVDRAACPWLISRFVDSDAEFLFVPESQINHVAAESGAIPFDAHGVELGHHGDKCSFETIIEHFALTDKALLRLAKIIHSADVRKDRDKEPLAAGFEAIAVGYSLRFPDDLENLARQFDVYDALYAWCRLQTSK
ncbi:MAG: chromate resistance protein [Anaerolineaceae bacterium]|nr:chromate resistance protein [Anaerolineaceae bacterium]